MESTATMEIYRESELTGGLYGGSYESLSYSNHRNILTFKTKAELSSNKYKFLLNHSQDKDFIVEINKEENWHILEIVDCAFRHITTYLKESETEKYELCLKLYHDLEIPDWTQFAIEVKSSVRDFDSREKLWDKMIEIFDKSYDRYIKRTAMSETEFERDAYRRIAIIVI